MLHAFALSIGQLYCRKDAKNFGQCFFLQHEKMNDEQFRAFFVGEN
jgi:hypothetical protein